MIAQVTEHDYNNVTGQHLPTLQGARLIGTYDSVVSVGKERALVVWQRSIMPDHADETSAVRRRWFENGFERV